jgi:hypothetical protein
MATGRKPLHSCTSNWCEVNDYTDTCMFDDCGYRVQWWSDVSIVLLLIQWLPVATTSAHTADDNLERSSNTLTPACSSSFRCSGAPWCEQKNSIEALLMHGRDLQPASDPPAPVRQRRHRDREQVWPRPKGESSRCQVSTVNCAHTAQTESRGEDASLSRCLGQSTERTTVVVP